MAEALFRHRKVEQKLTNLLSHLSDDEKTHLLAILNNSVSEEKRVARRRRLIIPADVICQNRLFYSRIENLSQQGAFIQTDHLIPPGNEIILSFSILNFEFPIELRAEVIRISKHGIGIKFKPFSALSYRLAIEKLSDAINPKPAKV